jgi:hypothetical protein
MRSSKLEVVVQTEGMERKAYEWLAKLGKLDATGADIEGFTVGQRRERMGEIMDGAIALLASAHLAAKELTLISSIFGEGYTIKPRKGEAE